MTSFDLALAFTLKEEGGYVDNPKDSGRATNRGVTQARYDAWRDIQKLPRQAVKLMMDAEVPPFYLAFYWQPGKCDLLPEPLAIAHFDWCVNHGVQGAIITLQQALGVTQDGKYGPASAAAVAAQNLASLLAQHCNLRRQWYRQRVVAKPDQQEFLDDWLGRVYRLEAYLVNNALWPGRP